MIRSLLDTDMVSEVWRVGWADPLIAAIAFCNDATLVTGNTDHFARVQTLGYPLRLENWREPRRG